METSMIVSNLKTEILTGAFTVCGKPWAKDGTVTHNDPFSRLYWIEEGAGTIVHPKGTVHLSPGSLFVIPEHTPARYRASGIMKLHWIHFRARLFGCIDIFPLMNWPFQVSVPDPDQTGTLMKSVIQNAQPERTGNSLRADANLRLLLCHFAATGERTEISHFGNFQRLLPVVSFIEQNLQQKMTLKKLSRVLPLQPAYLCHLFSRTLGLSPIDFINRKRIEKAQFLLRQGTMPLKEVAAQIGFQDVYFFSRTFKKIVGIAPIAYRRQKLHQP
jgi:AraC-like DNA-binding protein